MNLKSAYKALSDEQLEILKTKTIQGRFKPKVLVKLLRELVAYDRVNDDKRQRLTSILMWFSGITFFSVFAAIAAGFIFERLDFAVCLIGIGLICFAIRVITKNKIRHSEETDLTNEMRRVLFPFALTMQEEIKPGSKISVQLNANNLQQDEFLTNDQRKHQRYGRSIKTYTQNWLSANVTLIDNTNLQIDCEKTVHAIKLVKLSQSGKTKHKSKTKSRDDIVIKALISKQQYELLDNEVTPNISIEERPDAIAIRAKYKFKTAGLKTIQAQTMFDLIHQIYSHVKPI